MEKFQSYMNEQFIGKDPNRTNIGKDIFKSLKENWIEKMGYIPLKPMALIKVTEPDSEIIKGIGFSAPNDLLLDNFGILLSSCINTGTNVRRDMVAVDGATYSVFFQEEGAGAMAFENDTSPVMELGGLLQLGSGTTTPLVTDYKIETALSMASLLDGFLDVRRPVWITADQEAIVTSIMQAGDADFISECGMFFQMRIGATISKIPFMMSHDVVSVGFSDLDHIEIIYTWSLR